MGSPLVTPIVILLLLYLFWVFWFRHLLMVRKHGMAQGIPLGQKITAEMLLEKLQAQLRYPDLKAINYDEEGDVIIIARHGNHALIIENNLLFVQANLSTSKEEFKQEAADVALTGDKRPNLFWIMAEKKMIKRGRYTEEAECLRTYIWKLFDSQAPVNPYARYKAAKKFKSKSRVITAILVIALAVLIFRSADNAGLTDQFASNNISASYLTQYSSTVTIGEAFNRFFGDPKWKPYNDGLQKYIDFQGSMMLDDERVTAIITFAVFDDSFQVNSVKINGEEQNALFQKQLFEAIYESYHEDTSSPAAQATSSGTDIWAEDTDWVDDSDWLDDTDWDWDTGIAEPAAEDTIDNYLGHWTPDTEYGSAELTIAKASGMHTLDFSWVLRDGGVFLAASDDYFGYELPLQIDGNTAFASYTKDGWGNEGMITLSLEGDHIVLDVVSWPNGKYGDPEWSMDMENVWCYR